MFLLGGEGGVVPAHLTVGQRAVTIGYEHLIGESGRGAYGAGDTDGLDVFYCAFYMLGGGAESGQC